jgi:hypothetical protein
VANGIVGRSLSIVVFPGMAARMVKSLPVQQGWTNVTILFNKKRLLACV